MVAWLTVARPGQQIGCNEGWAILPPIMGIWLSIIGAPLFRCKDNNIDCMHVQLHVYTFITTLINYYIRLYYCVLSVCLFFLEVQLARRFYLTSEFLALWTTDSAMTTVNTATSINDWYTKKRALIEMGT